MDSVAQTDRLFGGVPIQFVERKTMRAIIEIVCETAKIGIRDVLSVNKALHIIEPRHAAMYLLCRSASWTTTQIGVAMNRDHSTVIHARDRVTRYRQTDHALATLIEKCERKISEKWP